MHDIKAGTWVEIENILLTPDQRAPQTPEDTRQTPYMMKVAGFLTVDALFDSEVTIKTLSGRLVNGTMKVVRPHYAHSFGDIVEELIPIGLGGEI